MGLQLQTDSQCLKCAVHAAAAPVRLSYAIFVMISAPPPPPCPHHRLDRHSHTHTSTHVLTGSIFLTLPYLLSPPPSLCTVYPPPPNPLSRPTPPSTHLLLPTHPSLLTFPYPHPLPPNQSPFFASHLIPPLRHRCGRSSSPNGLIAREWSSKGHLSRVISNTSQSCFIQKHAKFV